MALYDPATGRWVNYNPSTLPDDQGGGYTPSSLSPVDAPAGATGPGLVDPTGGDPSAIASQLIRSQFADWQKLFQPIELRAMQDISFNNPNVLNEAVSKASTMASGQSGAMRGILERQNAAMGVTPTPQQRKVMDRTINLNQAANISGAENTARSTVRTLDEQILLGAVPNPNIVRGTIQQ